MARIALSSYDPGLIIPGRKPLRQSKINFGHPLARKLVICLPLNEKGEQELSQLRDQVSGRKAVLKDGYVASWGYQRGNSAIEGLYLGDFVPHTGQFTICVKLSRFANLGEANQTLLSGDSYVSGAIYRSWQFRTNESGGGANPQLVTFHSGTVRILSDTGTIIAAGMSIAGTARAGEQRLHVNGVQTASASHANAVDQETAAVGVGILYEALGAVNGDAYLNGSGAIEYVYMWDRVLSPAEIRSIHADPYQFLRPVNDPIFLDSAAAPAGSIARQHFHHRHHNRAG